MPESDFLGKILSESIPIRQPSLADQWMQIVANLPKKQTMLEILNLEMNKQPEKTVFDGLDQNKETKAPPENPKYVLNRKNFAKLIDTADIHDSKIEMVCCKAMDLEDNQASIQKELERINAVLKKHETTVAVKDSQDKSSSLSDKFFAFFSKDIHWKSFAGGVLALAAILAFIYMKL